MICLNPSKMPVKRTAAIYDPKEPLPDAEHEKFAQLFATECSAAEAWRQATKGDPTHSDANGAKWAVKGSIPERVAFLKKEGADKWRIDKEKYGRWLEDILLAKPMEAADDSVISATVMTKAGPFTAILDKLGAAEKLAKLRGFNEPDKVAVSVDDARLEWAQRVRGRKE